MDVIAMSMAKKLEKYFKDTWKVISPLPSAIAKLAAIVLNKKIYIMGGADASANIKSTVYVYNQDTDTYTTVANMPLTKKELGVVVSAGKIYVLGGNGPIGLDNYSFLEYNPNTNIWTSKISPDTPVIKPLLLELNGLIYKIAGKTSRTSYSDVLEKYNPNINTWEYGYKERYPLKAGFLAGGTIEDKIYTAGGCDWGDTVYKDAYMFNSVSKTWSSIADLPTPIYNPNYTVVENELYLFGGRAIQPTSTGQRIKNGYKYNPIKNAWEKINSSQEVFENSAITSFGSSIYIFGGETDGYFTENIVVSYATAFIKMAPEYKNLMNYLATI